LLTFLSFFLYQKDLCDAWITTLGMRKSVALKRFQLQLFRNNWKLMTVLKGQVRTSLILVLCTWFYHCFLTLHRQSVVSSFNLIILVVITFHNLSRYYPAWALLSREYFGQQERSIVKNCMTC
jgi:hypothetical protein